MGALDHQTGDLFEAVVAWLDANNGQVETIDRLEQSGALADPHTPDFDPATWSAPPPILH